ncbi:MAG: LPS export ABC transporter periplasmic protein LptC [Sulfurospirillum sp.]
MAVRLLKYFLLFFVLIMIFLLTKNPYYLEYNSSGANRPEIEIFNMRNYDISQDGVTSIVFAKKVEKYKSYDKMYSVEALHEGKLKLIDSLIADKGLFTKNILYLDDNVKYTRSDDLALNTNSIKYDIKKKILSSNIPFEFIKKNATTHGSSFTYDMQKGIIRAKDIKTVIRMD